MGWIDKISNYSVKINIYDKSGLINAMDAISWANAQFGPPECSKNKDAIWNIDSDAGYFIFYFKSVEDCTLFQLTIC